MSEMLVDHKYSLHQLNSLGVDVNCKDLKIIKQIADIPKALNGIKGPWMALGGGSNILFKSDFPGTILKIEIFGKSNVKEEADHVFIKVGAGESWHEFVIWAVDQGYGGIENLALIPGSVGAAPIQNIGAYGVEIKDVFESLNCFDTQTGELVSFDNTQCEFGYRDSIFKTKEKGRYIICELIIKLTKSNHQIQSGYAALEKHLTEKNISSPNIKDIREAVIAIRQSKLPDPAKIGNAGSFFKNPLIPNDLFNSLRADFPNIPSYPVDSISVKVPAAWLIDQCGWKGSRFGDAGVYPKQALVIVNYGNATGTELVELSQKIQKSVLEKFGVALIPEVNIV
jgi:UDP-N-acetylmuramate dehydrogenase